MLKTFPTLGLMLLFVLSLPANAYTYEEKGFTVTYLMLERNHLPLPQNTVDEDNNRTETTQKGGTSEPL
jgi:hypothetical protein